jgi:hypothetical protein
MEGIVPGARVGSGDFPQEWPWDPESVLESSFSFPDCVFEIGGSFRPSDSEVSKCPAFFLEFEANGPDEFIRSEIELI